MNLVLQRQTKSPQSTQGEMTLDDQHVCWTLERPLPEYPADFHCIPAGTYPISLYPSPHFGRLMPLLAVPGHSGIEIHYGNYPLDSKGCILVGKEKSQDAVWHSREMFAELFPVIQAAIEGEGCSIEIRDIFVPDNAEAVQDAAVEEK